MFVKVLLYDPQDQPLMLERGFKVSPGFATQVAEIRKQYFSISWQQKLTHLTDALGA